MQRPRQHLARITHIELGDLVRAPDRLGGVTSRSYAGPVFLRTVVADIVDDMFVTPTQAEIDALAAQSRDVTPFSLSDLNPLNTIQVLRDAFGGLEIPGALTLGPLDAIPAGATVTDYTYTGVSTQALTALLKRVNVRWFEDDGVVRFRSADSTQPDAPSLMVTPMTGLVGAPEPTDEGAEVVMFLNPQAKIGGQLSLQSDTLTGQYRIVALRHEFDNWDGAFTTWTDLREMECKFQ